MVECEYKLGAGVEAVELSFNRYMVECESVQSYANLRLSLVLIDTWWNVNFGKEIVDICGYAF